MSKPDWEVIRHDYEQGASLRLLEERYGVSKSTIDRHAKTGQWDGTARNGTAGQSAEVIPLRVVRNELPSIASAVDGANLGITALVQYLRVHAKEMDLSDHVKAATALSQYNRIIVNAEPADEEQEDTNLITVDTRELSASQLAKLKAFALDMKESG